MMTAKMSRGLPQLPSTAFPAPDHDHDRCLDDAMTVAEARCNERGQRLTPIRRKVLAVLLGSHKALGAYDIIERLAPERTAPGAHHRLSRARVPARQRPGAPDRQPQCIHCLRAQSCCKRSRRLLDLRGLRRGRRGVLSRGHRNAHICCSRGRLHAEITGDRDHRHLHPLHPNGRCPHCCLLTMRKGMQA